MALGESYSAPLDLFSSVTWELILCTLLFVKEEPPLDLITSMKVPSTDSIRFHGIETIGNVQLSDHSAVKTEKLQISEIPFSVQVDDIKSLFLQVSCSRMP